MTGDISWHGPDPLPDLAGPREFAENYWLPLRNSFPGLRRVCHMFFGGCSNGRADGEGDGRMWVGGTGWFSGTFARDWLSISATGKEARIRWGELCRVEDGQISEVFTLLDIVDLMQQAGLRVLPPARGADSVWRAPRDDDAIYLEAQDPAESARTLDLIRRFIFDSLNVYDQKNLESMGVADYFPPDIQWYGPAGMACWPRMPAGTWIARPRVNGSASTAWTSGAAKMACSPRTGCSSTCSTCFASSALTC